MGFIRFIEADGRVSYDSRREEISAESNDYINALSKALDHPGLEKQRAELIESATAREYAEHVEESWEREMGIETRQAKKRDW